MLGAANSETYPGAADYQLRANQQENTGKELGRTQRQKRKATGTSEEAKYEQHGHVLCGSHTNAANDRYNGAVKQCASASKSIRDLTATKDAYNSTNLDAVHHQGAASQLVGQASTYLEEARNGSSQPFLACKDAIIVP